ncbi:hypothetical protein [Paenibacillus alba]|uniref:Uncharacterized protein n=1 Tax=Paenibacillus alba TaxID=1197127 RepID=A0ABU6G8Q4_9BACL|nr:hypothetical protein [Paenibacillus alba]MEC0230572.1 hypothetical protein [Paenibacillus alba]
MNERGILRVMSVMSVLSVLPVLPVLPVLSVMVLCHSATLPLLMPANGNYDPLFDPKSNFGG